MRDLRFKVTVYFKAQDSELSLKMKLNESLSRKIVSLTYSEL